MYGAPSLPSWFGRHVERATRGHAASGREASRSRSVRGSPPGSPPRLRDEKLTSIPTADHPREDVAPADRRCRSPGATGTGIRSPRAAPHCYPAGSSARPHGASPWPCRRSIALPALRSPPPPGAPGAWHQPCWPQRSRRPCLPRHLPGRRRYRPCRVSVARCGGSRSRPGSSFRGASPSCPTDACWSPSGPAGCAWSAAMAWSIRVRSKGCHGWRWSDRAGCSMSRCTRSSRQIGGSIFRWRAAMPTAWARRWCAGGWSSRLDAWCSKT